MQNPDETIFSKEINRNNLARCNEKISEHFISARAKGVDLCLLQIDRQSELMLSRHEWLLEGFGSSSPSTLIPIEILDRVNQEALSTEKMPFVLVTQQDPIAPKDSAIHEFAKNLLKGKIIDLIGHKHLYRILKWKREESIVTD